MPDYVIDGQPFETPAGAANQDYAATAPTLAKAFQANMDAASVIGPLGRASQRGQFAGSSILDQWIYGAGAADAEQVPNAPDLPLPGSVQTPILSPDEANARFAPIGADGKPGSITDKPIPEGVAQLVGQAKADEIKRETILARYANAHSWPVNFGVGLAAFMTDPLNIATMFIPGVGEDAIAARLGTGLAARIGARTIAGGATGAAAQAPLSALRYGLGTEEASDYDLRAAFRDMAFGAAGGAVLHAGFGTVGEMIVGRTPEIPGGTTPPLETNPETTGVLTADIATRHAAMRTSIAQLLDGREVDVRPYFQPRETDTAIGRALSAEQPLRPELQGIAPTVEEQGRQIAPDVFAKYDPLAAKIDTLRQQIADPEATWGTAIDAQIADADARAARVKKAAAVQWQKKAAALRDSRADTIAASVDDARRQIAAADQQMRDLAPAVSDATARAEQLQGVARAMSARVMGPPAFPDAAALANHQAALYREGFAPGITQTELRQVTNEIYGPKETPATAREPSTAQSGEAAGTGRNPALADAESQLKAMQASGAELHPEDQAELARTEASLTDADNRGAAMDEAAECLKGGGA